jgi:hypothetical protein
VWTKRKTQNNLCIMRGIRYLCYSAGCFIAAAMTELLMRAQGPRMFDDIFLFRESERLQAHSHPEFLLLLILQFLSLAGGVFWLFCSLLWAITDHSGEQRTH